MEVGMHPLRTLRQLSSPLRHTRLKSLCQACVDIRMVSKGPHTRQERRE